MDQQTRINGSSLTFGLFIREEDEAQQAEAPAAIEQPVEKSGDRETIEKEFNELQVIGGGDLDVCRVKFQFPDNSHLIDTFPRGLPASILFVVAQCDQFPREFALETGYQMKRISEDDVVVEEACGGRQVQVYVIDPDD
jgi:hypothetical protein